MRKRYDCDRRCRYCRFDVGCRTGSKRLCSSLIETKPPALEWDAQQLDAKVSAVNLSSYQILKNIKAWPQLSASAMTPLKGLRVWDATGGSEINFDSKDLHLSQLGFIVENRALIKVLWELVSNMPNVTIQSPATPLKIIQDNNQCVLHLKDQSPVTAELIVGADGSESWVRQQMQITASTNSYQQEALTAVLETAKPHHGLGWQNFLDSGPIGILPLHHPRQVAMVWSNDVKIAEQLKQLTPEKLAESVAKALNYRLGEMKLLTPVQIFPLFMRSADVYIGENTVLIGDAAHTIHPLAGQGVNLGLMDAAVLVEVLVEAQQKKQILGAIKVLSRYQRWRKGDNMLMLTAMTGFKELFGSQNNWVVKFRNHGLTFTNHVPWLKNFFMRYAIGQRGDLPQLAQQ